MHSPYFWTRGLEKYAYTPDKKINRLSYPSPFPGSYLYITYRSWSRWAPGRWVLFIHCNPTSIAYSVDSQETEASIKIAQALGFGGLGILYLFGKKERRDFTKFTHEHIGPGAAYWIKQAKRQFKLYIAAWGDRGTILDRDINIWLSFRPMLCLDKTEKGNPLPSIDYVLQDTIKLKSFYINPAKRGVKCDLINA